MMLTSLSDGGGDGGMFGGGKNLYVSIAVVATHPAAASRSYCVTTRLTLVIKMTEAEISVS
jgi:hypothetical protein